MKLWYAIRRETAAAWRSLRYDLRRLTGSSPAHRYDQAADGGEPTTDLSRADAVVEPYPQHPRLARRPRRLRPAVGAALVAVLLAGITYLGVLQGLSALHVDETFPVSGLPTVAGKGRMGQAPPSSAPVTSDADPVPPAVPVPTPPAPSPSASPSPVPTAPPRPTGPPESTKSPTVTPSCPCATTSPSPTPSTPTPSASPTPTADPTPSPSATPSGAPSRAADPRRAVAS